MPYPRRVLTMVTFILLCADFFVPFSCGFLQQRGVNSVFIQDHFQQPCIVSEFRQDHSFMALKSFHESATKLYSNRESGKRRRRSKATSSTANTGDKQTSTFRSSPPPTSSTDKLTNPASKPSNIENGNSRTRNSGDGTGFQGLSGFNEEVLSKTLRDSKLPPLAGTAAEKQAKYNQQNKVQRYIEELLAPTPVGQEPKAVQLAKTITWGAVLLLVVVEIIVSVKVGGAPFDSNKVSFTKEESPATVVNTITE